MYTKRRRPSQRKEKIKKDRKHIPSFHIPQPSYIFIQFYHFSYIRRYSESIMLYVSYDMHTTRIKRVYLNINGTHIRLQY